MLRLPLFTKSHSDTNKFLTIDISQESVKCLAFYHENDQAKIIGVGKEKLDLEVVRNGGVVDFNKLQEATRLAVSQATLNSEEKINGVIFGTRADMSSDILTTARSLREKSGPVLQKELKSIHDKILGAASSQAGNELMQTTGNSDTLLELITSTTVYSKIDNKRVSDLEGEDGSEIELAIFTSFSPNYHIKNLHKLANSLKLDILAIASEAYSLVKLLKLTTSSSFVARSPDAKVKNNQNIDCILINIGPDTTDVAVVFGGAIVATKNLPLGLYDFTGEVSQTMGLAFPDSEKLLTSYIEGKLEQSEAMLIQNCLQEVISIWLEGIELLFAEFSGVKTFASSVYVTGEGAQLTDAINALSKEPWTKSIPFKSPPEFTKLSLSDYEIIHNSTGTTLSDDWLPVAGLSMVYLEIKSIV